MKSSITRALLALTVTAAGAQAPDSFLVRLENDGGV